MLLSATLTFVRRLYTLTVRAIFWALWYYTPRRRPLPPIKDPILVQPAHVLAEWIRTGKVSSEVTVRTFIERIQAVNPFLNAVVDNRFDEALEEAREVDKNLASSSPEEREALRHSKPLMGVPFTSKENVRVNGLSHTGGVLARRGVKATEDAVVIKHLKEAGGIPLCVSNVPELGVWWETVNYVYGRTSSAHDDAKTPGGSSGGEAALLASCATPLSVGSDVGGSIRIPAYCSGVFGHKPTSGWVSLQGAGLYTEKLKKGKVLVVGPLARTVQDLVLALQVQAPQDAAGLQDKIRNVELTKVKVWWAEDLGSPLYSPVDFRIRDILHRALHFLDHSNVAHVEKFPVDMSAAYQVWNNKMGDDYKDEPGLTIDMTDRKGEVSCLSEWVMWLTGQGCHIFPILVQATLEKLSEKNKHPETSMYYWNKYKEKCLEVLADDGVLILPVLPMVSPYHYEAMLNPFDFCYCSMFNAIEFPSTAVPLGVTKDGPIGLQVVTTPGNDHLSLAVASALEKKFGGWVPPENLQAPLSSKKET